VTSEPTVTTTPRDYFDRVYASTDDPWGFRTRWYERRKQAVTVAALPAERYRRAFEPGCSVGALTQVLAPRCDELLAVDLHPRVVDSARSAVGAAGHGDNVTVEVMDVALAWPPGTFDLVVLSEVGYYFAGPDLAGLVDRAVQSLDAGGALLGCHWRQLEPDHLLDGASVHEAIDAHPALRRTVHHEDEQFLLDVWARVDTAGVPE
jgi:SAM-dependent methyltransferase